MSVSASGSTTNELVNPLGGLTGNAGKANTTVISRARFNLNNSFTGEDLLLTRLEVGNGGTNLSNSLDGGGDVFAGFAGFANSSKFDASDVGTTVSLNRLRYDSPIGKDIRASIGTAMSLNDHLDANSFANDESADFQIGMFINNPLILPVNDGAGGAIVWNIGNSAFTLRAGYVAANANIPTNNGVINRGLFGDPYQGTVELEFAPKNTEAEIPFAIRLQYTRASVNNLDYNTGGVNLEWAFNKAIAFFGRYGFGNISNRGTAISAALPTYTSSASDSLNPQTWSAGITPDLQFIFNPNNNSGNSMITVGTIRTVFSF